MKIALVVPYLTAGGMETYIFRLGAYLRKMGHSITIITTEREGEWWNKCESLGFARCAVLLKDSFNRITHVPRVRRALLNYDALLLNDSRYAKAALAGLPERIAVISVIHNDDPRAYDIACTYPDLQDAVVAISPRTCRQIAGRIGSDKTVLILHGVEAGFRGNAVGIASPVRLLYCGRVLQSQKNVFLLPEICAALRQLGVNFTLEIVGDGPDLPGLKERFRKAGLDELLNYSETLPPERVYSKLAEAHVLLMPSFYEGFPLMPLEAQACGCVPVISRLPGITDVTVVEGRTGLLAEPGSAGSFADAVHWLVENRPNWHAMSEAGMRRIRDEFSVEKMGAAYLELIEQILAQKPSALTSPRPHRTPWNAKLLGSTAPLPNALCRALRILK